MAINLDLFRHAHQISASTYSGRGDSLLGCQSSRVSDRLLESLLERATQALEAVLGSAPNAEDEKRLEAVAESIASVLPSTVCQKLASKVAATPQELALRLQGDLAFFPWELLHVGGGRLLGEAFDVGRQVVVGSAGAEQAGRVLREPVRVLVLADPDLPYALREGQDLVAFLEQCRPRVKVSFQAGMDEEGLLRELQHADILHFAGEAEADRNRPEEVGWRIGARDRLTWEALWHHRADHWPVLVFANACNSAQLVRQANSPSESAPLGGMPYAFLRHGARHYLSAVARIPDAAITADLAQAFYSSLLSHATVGAALRAARDRIRLRPDGSEDPRGRLLAANYLLYGKAGDCLFDAPRPSRVENADLGELVQGLTAALQGNLEQARACYQRLREHAPDGEVASLLDQLLTELGQDRERRVTVQRRLREDSLSPQEVAGGRVGPYEICDRLGSGSYRTVYLARAFTERTPEPEVALWVPHNQTEEVVVRDGQALRELAPKLDHPNLVRIFDVGVYDGAFVLACEYAQGASLRERLEKDPAPWPLERVCELMEAAGSALDAAHKQEVVHGELSPEDLLLGESGLVKVLDVGLASALRSAGHRRAAGEAQAPYRAPEQWEHWARRQSPGADRWALAVIAYELLTGQHPFAHALVKEDGGPPDWATAMRATGPRPAQFCRADLSEGVSQVLLRAMSRSPTERFGSCAAFASALRRQLRPRSRVGGFEPDLELLLDLLTPVVCVQSQDEHTVLSRLARLGESRGQRVFVWRASTRAVEEVRPEGAPPLQPAVSLPPLEVLRWFAARQEPALLVLLDYDVFLDDGLVAAAPEEGYRDVHGGLVRNPPRDHGPDAWDTQEYQDTAVLMHEPSDAPYRNPVPIYPKDQLRREVQNLIATLNSDAREPGRGVLIVAPAPILSDPLGRLIPFIRLQPPGLIEIEQMLGEFAAEGYPIQNAVRLAGAYAQQARGLSESTIRDTLRLSLLRRGALTDSSLADLNRAKEQMVQRLGLLELRHPEATMDALVAARQLRLWVESMGQLLSDELAADLLPAPRGLLLGGMPGCGKSLAAEAVAGTWQWPLLRLDMGRIFGGRLGLSEANMREALVLADALSPAVLWVDEIEKGFGQSQGVAGTGARVFHTFLTWLQERSSRVFLVATANEAESLPAELIRAGRFDAAFFLDWPDSAARQVLLQRALARYQLELTPEEITQCAREAEGFSCAEVVGRVTNALYAAVYQAREDSLFKLLREAVNALPRPAAGSTRAAELARMRSQWLMMAAPADAAGTEERN